MSRPIPETPPLPYPSGSSNDDLNGFNQDLIKALYVYLSDVARRVNESLPKDGTEAMEADLDMGGFAIVNSSGGGGGGGLPETPLAIVHGGTTATTASGARTNLGLGNVDNTSDVNKPVSTAQAAADLIVSGLPEFLTYSPSADVNDYSSGMDSHLGRLTTILLTPTATMKLTGLVATGISRGKRVRIRNDASAVGASNYMIIIEEESASSSSGNRFHMQRRTKFSRAPLLIGPQRELVFEYDGSKWQLLDGAKGYERLYNGPGSMGNNTITSTTGSSTGSGSTFATDISVLDNNSEGHSAFRLSATTATAFGAFYLDWPASEGFGQGARWFIGNVAHSPLATGTIDYDTYVGIGNMNVKPAVDFVGWLYNRSVSTDWQTKSVTAGHTTVTTITGFTPTLSKFNMVGMYVNGDGTRADFFYSADGGSTWVSNAASHTADIPALSRTISGGFALYKKLSTTSVSIYADGLYEGQAYDS